MRGREAPATESWLNTGLEHMTDGLPVYTKDRPMGKSDKWCACFSLGSSSRSLPLLARSFVHIGPTGKAGTDLARSLLLVLASD